MTTLLLCCGAVAREVIALRDRHGWDAKILAVPASLHNRPARIPNAVKKRVTEHGADFDRVLVIYGDCGTAGALDQQLAELGVERLTGAHCYEQFAGSAGFASMMEEEPGTFFLTDFLATSFDHLVLEGLGLDTNPDLREVIFHHYRRVVYLQQRRDAELIRRAAKAAEALHLPLLIRPTGYGELETRLIEAMGNLQSR